jgi:alanyl-tRNA synthetase
VTERLYYTDSYLARFRARVVEAGPDGVVLDRTAFYPASGGQPCDRGTLGGVAVVEVSEEADGRVRHRLSSPLGAEEVEGCVDFARRFDHMQQHTGQETFGIATVSFHMGAAYATIDLAAPQLDAEQIGRTIERANAIIHENRPVAISFADSAADLGLRKESRRAGTLRVVTIEGIDRSACGGTHVRHTGEIGVILAGRTEKVRETTRLEFFCGARAVRRAQADFAALSRIARGFSATNEEAPGLVAALLEKSAATAKQVQKLAAELARYQARDLYEATPPDEAGVRRHVHRGAITETVRALAQAFAAHPRALFLAASEDPPALLLAAAPDSGVHAGNRIKELTAAHGGRGGGSATLAQGSFPSAAAFAALLK